MADENAGRPTVEGAAARALAYRFRCGHDEMDLPLDRDCNDCWEGLQTALGLARLALADPSSVGRIGYLNDVEQSPQGVSGP